MGGSNIFAIDGTLRDNRRRNSGKQHMRVDARMYLKIVWDK